MEGSAGVDRRVVAIAAGAVRQVHPEDWRDALVVVRRGRIELEGVSGRRWPFTPGDSFWLDGLPVVAIHCAGDEPAVLLAYSRRRQPPPHSNTTVRPA